MAKVTITVLVNLDNGTKVERTTVLENIDESKDYFFENEVLGMASPPPIIRPSNPRIK